MVNRAAIAQPAAEQGACASRRLYWLLPLIVIVVAYQMQRAVALLGLDLHHDTFMFDAARRLLLGELPFKDFFYQYNLGTLFLHAVALKVLGTQIVSLKIFTVYAYAVIALFVYACAAAWGYRWWAFAVALLWGTLSPFYMPALNGYHAWSTVYMMASVMAGALCLTMSLTRQPLLWAMLAGVSFNLAFWFKQVAGLQILAVLVWIAFRCFRSESDEADPKRFRVILVGYIVGGLLSALPFFYYLLDRSLIVDWLRSAFVFNGFFAATGSSASGMLAFALTLFPVAHDLGYWSFLWALMPLCLVVQLLLRRPADGRRLLSRSDIPSLGTSLFAVLALAGWIEFFPLAHAFHTHLFMAPMFTMLAMQRDELAGLKWRFAPRDILWPTIFLVTFAVAAYESMLHLRGLHQKRAAPSQVLRGNMPAHGMHLAPEHARSFMAFYEAMLSVGKATPGMPWIPMSVDPLRGLLPFAGRESVEFKMGVNWTWPNEIVEPGFNKRIAQRISERKSPVYADSLIAIPGYVPVALLEMPSPITGTHTLYVPSADPKVMVPQVRVITDSTVIVSSEAFPKKARPLINQSKEPAFFNFMKFHDLDDIASKEIADIHVSALRTEDIPEYLSRFQYEDFLKAMPSDLAASVLQLYEPGSRGKYELKLSIDHEEMLSLAKFMLSQGKLFEKQDRPLFFTTLVAAPERRPFLAMTMASEAGFAIDWAKSPLTISALDDASRNPAPTRWLAIPAGVLYDNDEAVIYVQFVLKNRTTRNFYLHYQPA